MSLRSLHRARLPQLPREGSLCPSSLRRARPGTAPTVHERAERRWPRQQDFELVLSQVEVSPSREESCPAAFPQEPAGVWVWDAHSRRGLLCAAGRRGGPAFLSDAGKVWPGCFWGSARLGMPVEGTAFFQRARAAREEPPMCAAGTALCPARALLAGLRRGYVPSCPAWAARAGPPGISCSLGAGQALGPTLLLDGAWRAHRLLVLSTQGGECGGITVHIWASQY